jgi:small subunit ribosomal protein S8
MSTDNISNMLSMLKNASLVKKEFIEMPYTKMNETVAKVLEKSIFLGKVKVFKEKDTPHKSLRLELVYEENGDSMIRDITKVSKSGRRIYLGSKKIKKIKPEFGVIVISTSKGVMSGEEARAKKLGGEIICEVI